MADGREGLIHKLKFAGCCLVVSESCIVLLLFSPSRDGGRLAWAELGGEKD